MICKRHRCEKCDKETDNPKLTPGWIQIEVGGSGSLLISLIQRVDTKIKRRYRVEQGPSDVVLDFCSPWHLTEWLESGSKFTTETIEEEKDVPEKT